MSERWQVRQGRWGAWVVLRAGDVMAVFPRWDHAYEYAQSEAGLIHLEVSS